MHVHSEQHAQAGPPHTSNNGEAPERVAYQEDDDTFGTTTENNIGLSNGKQNNGHVAQHTSNGDCNGIGNTLSSISSKMGLKPIRSNGYQPVRKSHAQSHEPLVKQIIMPRSNSDIPMLHNDAQNLSRRRPPYTRRKSEVFGGLQEPMVQNKNLRPNENTKTRQSFELKQNAIHSMQTDGTLERISARENLRLEEDWNFSQNIWRRLALQASAPDTSQKELIQRSTFLIISTLTVGAGVLWGFMYVALEEWTAAFMPFIYSTSMSVILFTCICNASKNGRGYDTFVGCQLAMILLLPFAVHVALGGVEKSGGVMLWSFLCPMGAAFFRSAKESVRWFWAYLGISGLLLVKGFWDFDPVVQAAEEWSIAANDRVIMNHSSSATIHKLYFLMNIIGVKCVIFAAVFLFARELEKEYNKSEEVLLNILPSSIVKRVKRGEFPIVDHVAGVTILFADLVGFTKASAELHPNFLIGLFLRDIFQAFDELVDAHGLEKIKTIGDAYMVVGGLNHGEKLSAQSQSQSAEFKGQSPHQTNSMFLAKGMFKALEKVNQKYNLHFDLRIGLHTGPVVAGVLGLKRFTYDVWGDSVNTASRMESNGVPGRIHLSSDMYESVVGMTNVFDFSCCGKINIKGKGEMITFLADPLSSQGQ
ncbi:hypothetical protein ACHAXR_006148 [Thalassiosira sp. AJA248-18]